MNDERMFRELTHCGEKAVNISVKRGSTCTFNDCSVTYFLPRQGDVESAMKYLEMFVELADRSQQLPEQQKACTSLGSIYNSLVRQTPLSISTLFIQFSGIFPDY